MAEDGAVDVERGADRAPSVFESIIDHEKDAEHDIHKDGADEWAEGALGGNEGEKDPGDEAPVFAFGETFGGDGEELCDLGIDHNDRKNDALNEDNGADETGEGQGGKLFFE